MAKDNNRRRSGETGLSLIEAIVVVTITALLALILLPMAGGSAQRNFALSERAIDAVSAATAEREFRALVRGARANPGEGAGRRLFDGATTALIVNPALASATLCTREGAPPAVTLAIAGDSLVCVSQGRRRTLLRWRGGEASFSYSDDGRTWRGASAQDGVLVRFELRLADGRSLNWVERAGAALAAGEDRT